MFDVASLIQYGGLLIVFLAVFGQTGLFFCFFLPSGGLIFTAGVFAASGQLDHHVATVCVLLITASVLGNITGYAFGRKAGPLLYQKQSRFFRLQHLQKAEGFFEKHGGKALAAGPFFPVIRTFAPIVAGMIKMDFRKFLFFTTLGSIGWILCFVFAGYLIGSVPMLKPYLNYIVLAIVILVTVPIAFRIAKELKKPKD